MKPTLLLTGATGAVGLPLLAALLESRRFSRVVLPLRGHPATRLPELAPTLRAAGGDTSTLQIISADLSASAVDLTSWPQPDLIVHAAASTHFRASPDSLRAINVDGTARLLRWAENLPRPPRFVHLSTLCVAGNLTGPIAERPLPAAPDFINAYEHSKWLAEQLVLASPLRPEVIRLGIVGGRESDGLCHRPGALHAALRWMRRGLLPLIPGETSAGVELISTDLVARFVLRLLAQPAVPHRFCHLSAGPDRLDLDDIICLGATACSRLDPAWRDGQILPPVIADAAAFASFRRSVEQSRDLLFNQVLASADAFLPVLLYPKQFATAEAERVWGGPLPWPDARTFAEHVITAAIQSVATPTEVAA